MIQRSVKDSGRKWTKQQEYLVPTGTPWARFTTTSRRGSWRPGKHGSNCHGNFLHGPFQKKLEGQIATAVVGATLLFGCEVRGFSRKEEREFETLWSRVVFGITRQKRGELEQEKKTLADLRIMCRMKPILDLIRIRQLNYLASLARLPDDRLEKIALRGHLIPEHAVGTSKAAPKNKVRNQYKKQLLSVQHLAPEELRSTWLRDWEKIAVDVVSWRKFLRKVCKWQDVQEEGRRYSNIHDHNVHHQEIIMTRKAAVDTLRLECTGRKAKCPLCQMEYGRSGLAVHFARCNQMTEEQRRIKTAARIREIGRSKTDLSVELNVPKKQVKQGNQEDQQNKEKVKGCGRTTEEFVSHGKKSEGRTSQMERRKRKHASSSAASVPSRRNEFERNKDERSWHHCFSWQISKLVAGRISSQQQSSATTLGRQDLQRRKLFNVRQMSVMQNWCLHGGTLGKKTLKDAANASIATNAWRVEMMKVGNYSSPTHSYVTVFLELQKSKTSRNCQLLSWLKAYRRISVVGVV